MPRKLIFVLYKLPELSTRDFAAEWAGDRHTGVVGQIPGLVRWVQNHVAPADVPDAPDGIGELWFDTDEALSAAMTSPEMGAAVEDAQKFLDMGRTYAVPVSETTVAGPR
jgi:uncharacterized protein (TIGR02118 family)